MGDVEPDRLQQLFSEQFGQMVRLATLLVGDVHIAEELVMDAFARVAARVDDIEHPNAYLRTAVVNATRSHHRAQRTRRDHAARVLPAGHTVDPEVDELWDRLAHLSDDERACVVLRYYEDLTVPQIAGQLGVPEGTVKSHLHRAIATLRHLLTEPTTDQEADR